MIKEFVLGCSKTVNLGNYNSIRVEASVTVTVPECDDFAALKAIAQEDIKIMIEETYTAQLKAQRQQS